LVCYTDQETGKAYEFITNINPASKYMTRIEAYAAYLIGLELK